jgi:hypothetical protein
MRKSILYSIFGFTLIFMACVDEIKLKLRQENKKLIIEGLVTNDKKTQFIRLSYTNPATDLEVIQPVKGAYIEVFDDENVKTIFRPSPDIIGLYKPENVNFTGVSGKKYGVTIRLNDGKEYKSPLQLMPVSVPIDKLNATFIDKGNHGLKIDLDFTDQKNVVNYYRWKGSGIYQKQSKGIPIPFSSSVCCDRCWVLKEDNSVNVFSDVVIDGGKIKSRPVIFTPFYLIGKNFIEIQQLVISREAYQFWIKYDEQIKRLGTIFDTLPAPIFGNVANIKDEKDIMLGYFEVAAISTKRIIPEVSAEQGGLISFYKLNGEYAKPEGDCMLAFSNSTYAIYDPPGW